MIGIDGWLTLEEAARRLGVGRERLERGARNGRMPAVKLPGGMRMPWLVKEKDAAAYVATVKRGPIPKPKAAG